MQQMAVNSVFKTVTWHNVKCACVKTVRLYKFTATEFTQRNFKQNLSKKTCKLLINSFYEWNKSLSSQENKADAVFIVFYIFPKTWRLSTVKLSKKKNQSKDIIDSLFDRFSAQFCFEFDTAKWYNLGEFIEATIWFVIR